MDGARCADSCSPTLARAHLLADACSPHICSPLHLLPRTFARAHLLATHLRPYTVARRDSCSPLARSFVSFPNKRSCFRIVPVNAEIATLGKCLSNSFLV